MSLKFFHVLFIAVSTVMAFGVGGWAIQRAQMSGQSSWFVLAGLAFIGVVGLIVYGNRFLQKARKLGLAVLVMAGLGWPTDALACPACVGTTESALQTGMNTGILALLGVIGFLLVCFASFFVHLARRARRMPLVPAQEGSI